MFAKRLDSPIRLSKKYNTREENSLAEQTSQPG